MLIISCQWTNQGLRPNSHCNTPPFSVTMSGCRVWSANKTCPCLWVQAFFFLHQPLRKTHQQTKAMTCHHSCNGTGFLTRINVNTCVNVYSANLVAVRKVWNCLSNLKSLLLLSLYGTMVGYLSLGLIKWTFSQKLIWWVTELLN